MKIEQNLNVIVTDEEKQIINKFNDILAEIRLDIQEYKDNGHMQFIDKVMYPTSLDTSFAIFEALNQIFE